MIYSDTGLEYINEVDYDTVFIIDNFDGDLFMRLHKAGCRILGPPVIIRCATLDEVTGKFIIQLCRILILLDYALVD